MSKRRIAIIDLVNNASKTRSGFERLVNSNQSNIMTEIVAVWCEQLGHDVTFISSAAGLAPKQLPVGCHIAIIGAFTRSAQLAYSISNFYRAQGTVTILGGPHARAYPHDSAKYFDYVVGFANKELFRDLLLDCVPNPRGGVAVSTDRQPTELPRLRERWKFLEGKGQGPSLRKMVHLLGSLGCPYTCSFCSDAEVKYRALDFESVKDDLRFLSQQQRHPTVAWDDPNFGVRFDEYIDAIEGAAPKGSVRSICHTSLSILTDAHVASMRRNGFVGVMAGIESWYEMGNKSKSGAAIGIEKVKSVSSRVNMIADKIPYVQTNLILGLDTDFGEEPFDLTAEFVNLCPRAVPYVTLITAFGRSAPLNQRYHKDGRILPFPFHLLNNSTVSNVKLRNYSLTDFFDYTISMRRRIFSASAIARRFQTHASARTPWLQWSNLVRAISSERHTKTNRYVTLKHLLDKDIGVRRFWEGETNEIPTFYLSQIRRDLGEWWDWLPSGALMHDPRLEFAPDVTRSDSRATATAVPSQ
jgi:hypothetical protein